MTARIALALLVACLAPPSAAAARDLMHVGLGAVSTPVVASERLIAFEDVGTYRKVTLFDLGANARFERDFPRACPSGRTPSWTAGSGLLAFTCGADVPGSPAWPNAVLIDAVTGATTEVDAQLGYGDPYTILAVGRRWLLFSISGYHYMGAPYLWPLHEAPAQASYAGESDRTVYDLDAGPVRPLCTSVTRRVISPGDAEFGIGPTYEDIAVEGRFYLRTATRRSGRPLVLGRCGGRSIVLTRCPGGCFTASLGRGWVTWGEGRRVIAVRLRDRRRLVWRLPAHRTARFSVVVHSATTVAVALAPVVIGGPGDVLAAELPR
jgi:hypothetical protein